VVTPDGPPNTLPPVVACPACKARVATFTLPHDARPRYCGHLRASGDRPRQTCELGGEPVQTPAPKAE